MRHTEDQEARMDLSEPSLFRKIERLLVYVAMGVVAFFLERIVLRANRK